MIWRATTRRALTGFLALAIPAAANTPREVTAEERSGCFAGADLLGGVATAYVTAEWYANYFEIFGNINSTSLGQTYRFKADGHSGAGRIFINHEYESGAMYMWVRDLSEARFILEVEGYGLLSLSRAQC